MYNLRTLFNAILERITNHTFQSTCLCLLNKLIIHFLVNICPRPCTATLSLQKHYLTLFQDLTNKLSKQSQGIYSTIIEKTWLKKRAKCASSTALSTSASSNTMNGDFPPSSRVTGLRLLLAANPSITLPVSVDPVKASCRKKTI